MIRLMVSLEKKELSHLFLSTRSDTSPWFYNMNFPIRRFDAEVEK